MDTGFGERQFVRLEPIGELFAIEPAASLQHGVEIANVVKI